MTFDELSDYVNDTIDTLVSETDYVSDISGFEKINSAVSTYADENNVDSLETIVAVFAGIGAKPDRDVPPGTWAGVWGKMNKFARWFLDNYQAIVTVPSGPPETA